MIDGRPGWEILGDVTPLGPGADDPAEGIEDIAKTMLALAGVLWEQAEVGQDEFARGVGDVAGIRSVHDHALNYGADWTKVHITL